MTSGSMIQVEDAINNFQHVSIIQLSLNDFMPLVLL